jgi:hypothetical protein
MNLPRTPEIAMTSVILPNTETHDRIQQLEHECRDMRRAMLMLSTGTVAAALVAVFAGGFMAAVGLAIAAGIVVVGLERQRNAVTEVVRVRKIEVLGADGSVRVAIGETGEGAGAVAAYDGSGKLIGCLPADRYRAPA